MFFQNPENEVELFALTDYNKPTYILLNWNNRLNDVLTFAHEAGHGINNELVKKSQTLLILEHQLQPEVASTFMEDFVLQRLLSNADDKLKLSI